MTVRWAWRDGAHVRIDADKAGRELERIRTENAGHLTREVVLERARSANSSLHDHFEWDDSKAAEQHRLNQAGELIRSIVIDVSRSNVGAAKPIRAFVSVERNGERSFTSTIHALSDKELRRQVLQRAWADLEAWRQRHAELVEFAKVFSAMDEVREALPV